MNDEDVPAETLDLIGISHAVNGNGRIGDGPSPRCSLSDFPSRLLLAVSSGCVPADQTLARESTEPGSVIVQQSAQLCQA